MQRKRSQTAKIWNEKTNSYFAKKLELTLEDQIVQAEVPQALHFVENNYSFSSTASDRVGFEMMFPDSQIARGYGQEKTNISYDINYGITPCPKEMLIRNMMFAISNFVFKFHETTNRQVRKQYDAYLLCWSKSYGKIVNTFCKSLCVGHCASDHLVDHFNTFLKDLDLDYIYLLQVCMDGPNVNLSFEKKLRSFMETNNRTSFPDVCNCSLHPVHTAFRKKISF